MITLMIFAISSFLWAMMPNTLHNMKDYIDIAENYPCVCSVYDSIHHINMTGVLIASDLVVTCSHGIHKGGHYILTFYAPQKIMTTSSTVLMDERYKILGAKFDIALLRLDKPIHSIAPAIMPAEVKISLPLTVVTCAEYKKRGFYLYELDKFSDAESLEMERFLQFSSIFFHPEGILSPFSTDEMRIRTKEAFSNWQKYGKGPYGLSLAGTSGAPVFTKYNGANILLGIVTSFATLDGKIKTPSSAQEAFGWYQTIFIPFYLQTKDYDIFKAYYKKDEEFQKLIKRAQNLPQKRNIFKDFYEKYICPIFSRSFISSALRSLH